MKAFFLFFFFFLIHRISAQVTNLKIGLWSDKTVWSSNSIPGINDTISLNYDITVDMNANCRLFFANGHTVTIYTGFNFNVLGNNTPADSTFTDSRDGKVYSFRHIGSQVWMTQNLNFLTSGSWCYDNNLTNCDVYGRLYDWNTALTVAPPGWHLPSQTEWQTLLDYLGGAQLEVVGDKMKEAGYAHWQYYYYNDNRNGVATNSSGFTALPGGWHNDSNGLFYAIGQEGCFWSSTSLWPESAWACIMQKHTPTVSTLDYYGEWKGTGYSIRCIRD